jgi:hypothetical protein
LPGFGDGAIWSAIPPGYKSIKSYRLEVIRGGHDYAYFSMLGIRDEDAEPTLTKLARLALERYEKTLAKQPR